MIPQLDLDIEVQAITSLHRKVINATGGSHGLRDINLLQSAVFSAVTSFGGKELYPSFEEKAARLAFAIIGNHPFIDGNKRIGVTAMLVTLRREKINMLYDQKSLVDLGMRCASGKARYTDVLSWVKKHKNIPHRHVARAAR